MSKEYNEFILKTIKKTSPKVAEILEKEMKRQEETIELIASENYPSDASLAGCGSIMACKYTEGFPNHRYYGGCENYDELETYGESVFQSAFGTDYHFNLQPHSGSSANCIAYSAVMEQGDTLLAMDMGSGAHLTHSSPVSFVSKLYEVCRYSTEADGRIDYDKLYRKAMVVKPKAIMCGASAYPRTIDFQSLRRIADDSGACLIADIAHISGLVISGDHPTPFGLADIVTFTTQKTFRSVRGGVVACRKDISNLVDKACFPMWQGGSMQNAIMGKVISAEEACTDRYKEYIHQVVRNSKAMCDEFLRLGYDVVTGGTDNHLFLLDFSKTHPRLTGREVQDMLDGHGITLNKNGVPNDKRKPSETSGVRIGLPAMTTKGWKEKDAVDCAREIDKLIREYCR